MIVTQLICSVLSFFAIGSQVSQSVHLGLEPLCNSWPDFSCSLAVTGLISWGVFPDMRTGLFYSTFCWSLLHLIICCSLFHLTLSGVFAWPSAGIFFMWLPTGVFPALPSTGVFFARPSTGVCFTWPSLVSSSLSQGIPCLLWNWKVHCLVQKYPLLDLIPRQLHPV